MPSSPDALAATRWVPAELREPAGAPAPMPERPPVFEVAGAALPEDLLAEARAAACAEGWSAGWAAGMRAAAARTAAAAEQQRTAQERLLAEQRAEAARAVTALDRAAAELERQAVPTAADLEDMLLQSAFAIAEALVGHAVQDEELRAPAALARVLALAPVAEPVTVRLSPADHARLAGDVAAAAAQRELTVLADPALAPGDAIATAGATQIDARIRAGVERVRRVLAP